MKKIIKYKVVHKKESYDPDDSSLTEIINKCIKEGWQPIGGVATSTSPNHTSSNLVYYQAMIKYEEEKKVDWGKTVNNIINNNQ